MQLYDNTCTPCARHTIGLYYIDRGIGEPETVNCTKTATGLKTGSEKEKALSVHDRSSQLFEEQLEPVLGKLYATARQLTRNATTAEDIVAEAVTKAWKGFDGLQDLTRFRPWVFRILMNTFRSQYRRQGREISFSDCGEGDSEDDLFWLFNQVHQPFLLWGGDQEQVYLNKLLREDLQRALDTLSEGFRAVILLVDVEEYSYQEVAEILAIPIGTVRSRLKRARSQMQKQLWTHAQEARYSAVQNQVDSGDAQ